MRFERVVEGVAFFDHGDGRHADFGEERAGVVVVEESGSRVVEYAESEQRQLADLRCIRFPTECFHALAGYRNAEKSTCLYKTVAMPVCITDNLPFVPAFGPARG
jgi:hypothetical protein